MIPIEAREQPTAPQTRVIVYSDVERQRMAQEGYEYVPTGVQTYGVPQEPAYYVKYETQQPPTWKETTVSGKIAEGGMLGFFAEMLSPLLPEHKRQKYREMMGVTSQYIEPKEVFISSRTVSGLIAGPEYYYRMLRGEPTPPQPAGALIGLALGRHEEYREFEAAPPAYQAGALMWLGVESYAFGKAVGYAWKGVKAVTPEAVKAGVHGAAETVKFSKVAQVFQKATLEIKGALPSWKGSRVETFLIQHVAPYRSYATKQLTYAEFGARLPERIGMEQLRIEQTVFQLAQYPRGQIVYISKIPVLQEATTKSMQHLFYRAGEISIGYLKQPLSFVQREATFTPIVSQAQVTRMGIHPYMPKAIPTITKATGKIGTVAGLTAITLPKLYEPTITKPTRRPIVEPVWQPTYAYAKERLRPQTLELTMPQVKEREPLIAMPKLRVSAFYKPKLEHFAEVIPRAEQIPVAKQRVAQLAIQKISLKYVHPPRLTVPSLPPMMPRLPQAFRRGGFDRSLRGAWFKKVHPIKTPEEMMATFGFGPRRRRVKRRGVK